MFNKPTKLKYKDIDFPEWIYFSLNKWVYSEDMTEKEKQDHPEHKTTGGYIKTYGYKAAWRKAFEEAETEDIKKTLELPNFNFEIFEEITGITKQDFDNRLGKPSNSRIEKLEKEVKELKEKLKEAGETV